MYRRLESANDDVLGFEVEGTISQDSFEELLEEVRRTIDRDGPVRLLVRIHGWPTSATPTLGERFRFARDHFDDIERYAVVADAKAIEYLIGLADAFVDMDLRFFELDEQTQAWDWVNDRGTPQEASA